MAEEDGQLPTASPEGFHQMEEKYQDLEKQYEQAKQEAASLRARLAEALSNAAEWQERYEQTLLQPKASGSDSGLDVGEDSDQTHQDYDYGGLAGGPHGPEGDSELARAWRHAKAANEKLLMEASRTGNITLAKQALADPAVDRNHTTKEHGFHTPLHLAVERDEVVLTELLLRSKANVNAVAKDGTTALHMACEKNLERMVKLLLRYGANPNITAQGLGGNSPLHVASSHGNQTIVEAILQDSREPASVDIRNENYETPLHLASANGHVEVAKALIAKGAFLEAREGSKKAETPLHRACSFGHLTTVQLLMEAGADPTAKTHSKLQHGRSALEVADRYKQRHVVAFLQKRGVRA